MRLLPQSPRRRRIFLIVVFSLWIVTVTWALPYADLGVVWPWNIIGVAVVLASDHVILILHELGHATAAWLLGMRVFRVVIGQDKVLGQWTWRRVSYEIHWLPYEGLTYVGPRTARWYRTRHMAMVAAGPAVTLAGFLTAYHFFYGEGSSIRWLPYPMRDASEWVGWFIVWVQAATIVINLWPRTYQRGGETRQTDGLQLLKTPFLTAAECEDRLATTCVLEAEAARLTGRTEEVAAWYAKGIQQYPENWLMQINYGAWLARQHRGHEARDYLVRCLNKTDTPKNQRIRILDVLACLPLYTGDHELLAEADGWSQQALELSPSAYTLKGTRGGVLVELGRIDEGTVFLRECLDHGETANDRAISACYLALAAGRQGNFRRADEMLALAQQHQADCVVRARITDELTKLRAIAPGS